MNYFIIKFAKSVIITSLCIFLLGSCMNEQKKNESTDEKANLNNEQTDTSVQMQGNIYTLPTPVQMASLIQMQGIKFSSTLLNPSRRQINYASNFSKALNFGIYSVDLGYATFYDQKQTALNYLSAIKKLGDELGISGAYEESAIKRYENNYSNKDTLIHIIMEGFNNMHNYLSNNNRKDIAVLCFAGCYLEGLYLVSNAAQNQENTMLDQKLGEQKIYLENMLAILDEYSDSEDNSKLMDKFMELEQEFSGVEIPSTQTDKGNIYDTKNIKITREQIKNIAAKVEKIRNEIIS